MNAVMGQKSFYIFYRRYRPIFLCKVLKEGSLGSSSLWAPKNCLILKITVAHRYSFRLNAASKGVKSAPPETHGVLNNSNFVWSLLMNDPTPRGHTLERFKPLAHQGTDERKHNTALIMQPFNIGEHDMKDPFWTSESVKIRLIEAADTLRKLPPIVAPPYLCSWPEFIRGDVDLHVNTMAVPRKSRATPREIREMDEAITWLTLLTKRDATLIWMRVNGKSWRAIVEALDIPLRTVHRHYKAALETLAHHLTTKTTLACDDQTPSSTPSLYRIRL